MDTPPLDWQILTASVRGAAHARSGVPNQDAIRAATLDANRAHLLALADGHGSAKSFRSQQGAQFAVEMVHQICGHLSTHEPPSRLKRWAEEQLPLELTRAWLTAIADHRHAHPFTPAELDALDAPARAQVEAHPPLAYGSTLLAVIAAPRFVLYVQLGDGDLLVVSASGEVERPLPRDPRLIANETTSLCSPHAWNAVQVRFQMLAGAPPALILAATDGYANAFRDEAGFEQAARDYWLLLRDGGAAAVQPYLADWLNDASQLGSGDDVSLGLVWHTVDHHH